MMKSNHPEPMQIILNFLLLLIFLLHVSGHGRVYNIVPTQISTHPCPVDSCLTLSQFAEDITHNVLASNMTLFISGEHHNLNVEFSLSHVAEFVILSTNITNYTSNPIYITCTESAL